MHRHRCWRGRDMRAAIFNGPRDIVTMDRPDPVIRESSDAIVRVDLACVCGSDLWYYRGASPHDHAGLRPEFIGTGEAVGPGVTTLAVDDFVVAPFAFSDGTCPD